MVSEVVDEHLSIDLRSVHYCATFPKQVRFFRWTFDQQIEMLPDQLLLRFAADLLLNVHELLATAFDFPPKNFLVEFECCGPFFVGVGEHTHPIEARSADEVTQLFELGFSFARESC